MKKVIFGTLIGFALFIAGIYVAFIAIQTMQAGGPAWLLLLSLLLGGGGMLVVYKSGRLDAFRPKAELVAPPVAKDGAQDSILEKNNTIIKEWNETNQKRDKLKMLEAAGAAEEMS